MIRVLIADDSFFMRKVLTDLFSKQNDFEVVATASNGKEAIEKVAKYRPDVVTMDINMPGMDGLTALSVIMKDCPVPVVMFSSLTKEGADATIKALSLGAVDFISKSGGSVSNIDNIGEEIVTKCRMAASVKITKSSVVAKIDDTNTKPLLKKQIALPVRKTLQIPNPLELKIQKKPIPKKIGEGSAWGKIVVIGTSTGGPRALQEVIPAIPKDFPYPILIVQHMPEGFTKSLAERLNEMSQISVKEAQNHDMIEGRHAYIAPGNYHMIVKKTGMGREIILNQDPPIGTLRPAADILFKSVAKYGSDVVSVILTGIGNDGAEGMKEIKENGGKTIAEDESTTIVYGMPKAVVNMGIVDKIVPLQEVATAIVQAVK